MSKKRKIKLTIDRTILDYMKESPEQRKERARSSRNMGTRVEQKKKAYKRHEKHKRGYDYE